MLEISCPRRSDHLLGLVKEKITKVVHSSLIAGRLIVASTLMSRVSNHSTGSLTTSLNKLKTSDVVNLISKASRRFMYDDTTPSFLAGSWKKI